MLEVIRVTKDEIQHAEEVEKQTGNSKKSGISKS